MCFDSVGGKLPANKFLSMKVRKNTSCPSPANLRYNMYGLTLLLFRSDVEYYVRHPQYAYFGLSMIYTHQQPHLRVNDNRWHRHFAKKDCMVG